MFRRLSRLTALAFSLCALAVTAGFAATQTAQSSPAVSAIPPIPFKERVLPNGLKLISSYDPTSSNVTVQVWYQVGSKDDPLGRSGFAHLFEHLMFKATRDLPPRAWTG